MYIYIYIYIYVARPPTLLFAPKTKTKTARHADTLETGHTSALSVTACLSVTAHRQAVIGRVLGCLGLWYGLP